MCGFSSCFHFDTLYNRSNETGFQSFDMNASLKYISHRGPDGTGKYMSPCGRCTMGHVRLSIIDLEGGHQPIANETDDIHCVVNGEFYDYEKIRDDLKEKGHMFKTASDSEIVLHLYEEYDISFIEYLRGEFSICIYDQRKSRMIVVRDHFGVKPVYYTVNNGTLLVASEIKAFLPMGWKAEWDVDSIVSNGPHFDNRTCFKGVYKLRPAHYLIARHTGSIDIQRYWDTDYPDKNIKETRSVDDMVQGVRDRLVESVKLRLNADVPVGVYLSGGIDSCSIAGIASSIRKESGSKAKIKAFSISFTDDAKFDESLIAERTAKFANLELLKIQITEDDMVKHFEESVWHVEQPQAHMHGVAKFILSSFVRDHGYKVVLTGEGSDEHFGGYGFFQADYLLESDHASPNGFGTMSSTKRKNLIEQFSGKIGFKIGKENTIENRTGDKNHLVNNVSSYKSVNHLASVKSQIYSNSVRQKCEELDSSRTIVENIGGVAREKARNKWHPLHAALYLEKTSLLPNYLLVNVGDRSEMAHSIEARTPFLDRPLCDYIDSLPPSLKIKCEDDGTLNEKWVLKEAVKPYVTEEVYKRTKEPFMTPHPSKEASKSSAKLVEKLLTRENIAKLGWADYDLITEIKKKFFKTGDLLLYRDLLTVMSYVVISERFRVETY